MKFTIAVVNPVLVQKNFTVHTLHAGMALQDKNWCSDRFTILVSYSLLHRTSTPDIINVNSL